MRFGERLKELREDHDEKQKDIADLLFVSNKVISDYERGIHFPRDERVITAIAKHYGVTTDYLFGITDSKSARGGDDFLSLYLSLSKEQKKEAIDFMQFLTYKDNIIE